MTFTDILTTYAFYSAPSTDRLLAVLDQKHQVLGKRFINRKM